MSRPLSTCGKTKKAKGGGDIVFRCRRPVRCSRADAKNRAHTYTTMRHPEYYFEKSVIERGSGLSIRAVADCRVRILSSAHQIVQQTPGFRVVRFNAQGLGVLKRRQRRPTRGPRSDVG